MQIPIAAIKLGTGHRSLVAGKVKELMVSIETVGLRMPITVRPGAKLNSYILVAGRHRMEACRRLGWSAIEAAVEAGKLDAKLWAIAENLHRADLTGMQRTILRGQWVRLRAEKIKQEQDRIRTSGGPKSVLGRPGEGITAAARELGIAPNTAKRSVRIAEQLSPQAQAAAVRLGLTGDINALDQAARSVSGDNQVIWLENYVKRQDEKKRVAVQVQAVMAGTDPPEDADQAFRQWYDVLTPDWQRRIRLWLREMDPVALADQLDKTAALVMEDARALH